MNLSPDWVEVLSGEGIDAVHWSEIGASSAYDQELMAWAKSNGYIVLTHDLDFGAILAATNADAPSVIQLRFQRRLRMQVNSSSKYYAITGLHLSKVLL